LTYTLSAELFWSFIFSKSSRISST